MPEKSGRSKRQKKEKRAAADVEGTSGVAHGVPSGNASQESGSLAGFVNKIRSNMGIAKVEDMTMWEILTSHPLVRVGKFILIPYLIYMGNYYLRLQHPEYVSKVTGGLIKLRPAVHGTETPRQVLIVATPGSGTVQMASELRNKLSLEIGHETTDAAWDFIRDGSVSWFHGIRFLTEPRSNEERIESLAKICKSDIEVHSNMGFHPAMYGPPRNGCSDRSKWDECWESECFVTLLKEWGCGATDSCEIKFARNIHQVRNPVNTLESLVVKYCVGGLDGTVAQPFLTYASALFPRHNFYADSCIEATGEFMATYLEKMLEARSRGDIDAFYRIEDSSACDVAEAAGLLSSNTTVYEPNHARIERRCDRDNNWNNPAQSIVEKKLNRVNEGKVRLGWMDLRGGAHGSRRKGDDRTLERRVRKLFSSFGYDETTIPLEYHEPVDSHSEL